MGLRPTHWDESALLRPIDSKWVMLRLPTERKRLIASIDELYFRFAHHLRTIGELSRRLRAACK